MKTVMTLWHKGYLIVLFLYFFSVFISGNKELRILSDSLDLIIKNKELYTEQKEYEINGLKKLLNKDEISSLEYVYEINHRLYDEYKKLKLDSAIYYASENVRIAQEMNNQHLKYASEINLASVYSFSGKILESEQILKNIKTKDFPTELLPDYYETYSRFYQHYATVSSQERYYYQVEIYRDSLLSVLDSSSYRFKMNMAHKYIISKRNDKAEDILINLLAEKNVDNPEYALITYFLGVVGGMKGQKELEKKYFIKSAIADVKNSIKENASLQQLARIYYRDGDITEAFRYAQLAIEDAIFSGVQFRTAKMSEFYSIINVSYQIKEAKSNSTLVRYFLLISVLSFFLILLVVYVYKQLRKLSRIKEELSQANVKLEDVITKLSETNTLTNERNEQLSESNLIKEQYIAQFFHQCSSYIDKMDEYRKTLYKLAINKNYDELVKKTKSTSVVEYELEELYVHFDNIFLSLYPTFVSTFNALLSKNEQITLRADGLLTRELRIYALLRLGITDGMQIANFLRCSLSTIYNYRSKMRNKAATNREQFEEMVMKIGVSKINK